MAMLSTSLGYLCASKQRRIRSLRGDASIVKRLMIGNPGCAIPGTWREKETARRVCPLRRDRGDIIGSVGVV